MAQTRRAKTQPETKTITLTQEQFSSLRSLVYENSIEEIEEICTSGEDDMKTIGFTLGGVYSELKKTFASIDEILDAVDPYLLLVFPDDEDENF